MPVEAIIALSVLGFILLILFGALAWALFAVYKGLSHSKTGLEKAHEGVELGRHSVDMQEKTVEQFEQLLKKQDEIIRLLRELCEGGRGGRFQATQS